MRITGVLIMLLSFAGFYISCQAERWTCTVYPDGNNLQVSVELGEFGSLQECRDAAKAYLGLRNLLQEGDYECGKNCRNDEDLPGIKICEETSD